MELEWETRPLAIPPRSRDWHGAQNFAGPSTNPTSSSAFISRRRSTAAHTATPGPPPTQPIPHLPLNSYDNHEESPSPTYDQPLYSNGLESQAHPYSRPHPSSNLVAVTAFSQSRFANSSPSTASSSMDNLSDPPPRSMLRPSTAPTTRTDTIVPDRLLLSPPEPRSTSSSERRPSPRSALIRALELARQAVQLDSTNDDPYGAVLAYGQSVVLLSEVMERVMRGEDSTESSRRRNGRRRSVVAQEEEVRRLKSIHDTYADRMHILSLIYSIPIPPHSPPSTYASSSISASTESTRPPSPSSASPTSESGLETRSRTSSTSSRGSPVDLRGSSETTRQLLDNEEQLFANGPAIFASQDDASSTAGPSIHPYAALPARSIPPISTSGMNSRRMSIVSPTSPPRPQVGRPRASSTLPPPVPPPTSLLPPAPTPNIVEPSPEPAPPITRHLDVAINRARGQSVSHKRTGSGSRLAALQEESEKPEDQSQSTIQFEPPSVSSLEVDDEAGRPRSRSAHRELKRESHPLPPLPSPTPSSIESATTPRTNGANGETIPPSPQSPAHFMSRPRGASTVPSRTEVQLSSSGLPLINNSTTMGTIFQRRNKMSAPPTSSRPSSPPDSSYGSNVGGNRLTASSLPASTANSLGMSVRNRASSQPGRRPSVVTGSHPVPPLSAGVPPNGVNTTRKVSLPSKGSYPAPPQITINTALLSPPLASSTTSTPLVPPPPIPHDNLPTAPMSPLPPTAPPDPLRKPYHMMNLLRQAMISKTGGYVTRRLHVPQEVWSQGGAKLANIPEKIRVVEVLCSALEEVHTWSVEYFGAGNVSIGMVMGIGSIGKKEGEAWASKLEEFSSVCDSVVGNFGKKLGVGEGFVTKKNSGVTSWHSKLTRQLDKLANGKNLDSPAAYVQGLSKLFLEAQILDEHTKALSSQPIAPLYASFPPEVRAALEMKLRHASEFFAKVVLTFVIRDLALLLDKYVKKCEKWLAE